MEIRRRGVVLITVAATAAAAFYATSRSLVFEERAALVVLIAAAGLWTTEAVPLAATSILIPLLQSLIGVQPFAAALRPFFDLIVMLLLGGFLLAVAVAVGITTSLDFMLPVGAPPNAIAYSIGKVSIGEMVKAGLILDIVGGLITVALAILLWPHLI